MPTKLKRSILSLIKHAIKEKKYKPHQGKQEKERRLRQNERAKSKKT
jgi:hypothetical protein